MLSRKIIVSLLLKMSYFILCKFKIEVVISQLHAKQSTVYKTKHDVIFLLFNTQLHLNNIRITYARLNLFFL